MSGTTTGYTPRFLPARLPRICVAIVASNPAEMVEKADAIVRENSFIEFRLDYLAKPALALAKIKAFTEYHPEGLIVATCRRAANGEKFRGTIAAQIDLLAKAALQGCHLVDVELAPPSLLNPHDSSNLHPSAPLFLWFDAFPATRRLH